MLVIPMVDGQKLAPVGWQDTFTYGAVHNTSSMIESVKEGCADDNADSLAERNKQMIAVLKTLASGGRNG